LLAFDLLLLWQKCHNLFEAVGLDYLFNDHMLLGNDLELNYLILLLRLHLFLHQNLKMWLLQIEKGQRDGLIDHGVCEYFLVIFSERLLDKLIVVILKRLIKTQQIQNFRVEFVNVVF